MLVRGSEDRFEFDREHEPYLCGHSYLRPARDTNDTNNTHSANRLENDENTRVLSVVLGHGAVSVIEADSAKLAGIIGIARSVCCLGHRFNRGGLAPPPMICSAGARPFRRAH